jgi:hypothetical protein
MPYEFTIPLGSEDESTSTVPARGFFLTAEPPTVSPAPGFVQHFRIQTRGIPLSIFATLAPMETRETIQTVKRNKQFHPSQAQASDPTKALEK